MARLRATLPSAVTSWGAAYTYLAYNERPDPPVRAARPRGERLTRALALAGDAERMRLLTTLSRYLWDAERLGYVPDADAWLAYAVAGRCRGAVVHVEPAGRGPLLPGAVK